MKRKDCLSKFEAWQKLLCGEHIAGFRLSDSGWCYLRRHALRLGRKIVGSGAGVYRTYSLT